MDKYHFGNSKCATDFVEVIKKNNFKSRRIVAFFTKTNTIFRCLHDNIKETRILNEVGCAVYVHKKDVIKGMLVPELCKSYMLNLLSITYKKYILKKQERTSRFWVKDNGDNCPICNAKLGACELGVYCSRENCPGRYVDGIARLTKAQEKQFKDIIIGPINWNNIRKK